MDNLGLNRWGYFVQARILRHQIMVTCLDFLKNGFDFKNLKKKTKKNIL
jgi:hypothetical protein